MSLKIDTGDITMQVISCYAPQTNCSEADKEDFWESHDAHLRALGPKEYIVIGGDLNGHVGRDKNGYERFHGGQGYGSRNEDGESALDCAEMHDLAVANTFFEKKLSHLVTYSSGRRETQIDYFLTRRQHLKLVTDVKVTPSTNICPQHRLLVMDLKLDLGQRRQVRTTNEEKIKWWRMAKGRRDLTEALRSTTTATDDNSVAKTAMRLDPGGQRPRGRPKKRWMDRIKEDMKIVNAAPEDALDRAKWRQICRKADPAKRDKR
ncbi:CFDP2 protein, partial [Polypterus senegalus]